MSWLGGGTSSWNPGYIESDAYKKSENLRKELDARIKTDILSGRPTMTELLNARQAGTTIPGGCCMFLPFAASKLFCESLER